MVTKKSASCLKEKTLIALAQTVLGSLECLLLLWSCVSAVFLTSSVMEIQTHLTALLNSVEWAGLPSQPMIKLLST